MQNVGQCPDCQAWFQAAVETTDRVRCPHCGTTLNSSQVRFQEVLPLQPLQDSTTVSRDLSGSNSENEPESIEITTSVPQIDESDPSLSHLRPRNRHPLWEIIKIAAGGIAGLVIAQLILWWLPGNLRRDPLQLAPRVPKWLHVILPEDLQPAQHSRLPACGDVSREL